MTVWWVVSLASIVIGATAMIAGSDNGPHGTPIRGVVAGGYLAVMLGVLSWSLFMMTTTHH